MKYAGLGAPSREPDLRGSADVSPRPRRRLPTGCVLLGIDGGATRVRAHEVQLRAQAAGGPPRPVAGARCAQADYPRVPGFRPVPLARQEAERDAPRLELLERAQGEAWVETAARCCLEVARSRGAREALVGACMPGLKTADRRGTAVVAHGPRIPDLLERLEQALRDGGLGLAAPIWGLASDGDAIGLGEDASARGALRGVADAYLVSAGTGLAEALKLGGRLVPFDEVDGWLPKAWRMELALDPERRHLVLARRETAAASEAGVEQRLSMAGINAAYAEAAGLALPLEPGSWPELRAPHDEAAAAVLRQAGTALGALVRGRMEALAQRPPDAARFPGPIALERVVLGGHLGRLWNDRRTWRYLRTAFELALFAHDGPPLRERYCERIEVRDTTPGSPREQWPLVLRRDLIAVSRLGSPAALGAALAAWRAWSGGGA